MGMGAMPCIATLTLDDITECRDNCSELSSAELDFAMLGIIHSCNKTRPSHEIAQRMRQVIVLKPVVVSDIIQIPILHIIITGMGSHS